MSKQQCYIKGGDSFSVPIQFIDTETNLGLKITPEMVITSAIKNLRGEVIATVLVEPYADQDINAGFILLSVEPTVTQTWCVGNAFCDVKVALNGQVKHSETITFMIKESITP